MTVRLRLTKRVLFASSFVGLLLATHPSFATPEMRGAGKRLQEPFESFRALDSNLSVLQKEFTEVRRGLEMGGPAETKQWMDAIHASGKTTLSIETLARRLKVHYRHTRQNYGTKVFRQLELQASSTRRRITRLGTSIGTAAKMKAADDVSESILRLVQRYQAVSAGYENSHCNGAKLACCLPRKTDARGLIPGCKWECVQRRARCRRGFLSAPL